MSVRPTLLVRADGGPEIGLGHITRCLAVAQQWRRAEGRCLWALCDPLPLVEDRLREEGIETVRIAAPRGSLEDAGALAALAAEHAAGWLLVDGYGFRGGYQDALVASGMRVAWLDDQGLSGPFSADLVINPNAAARSESYADRQPRTRLLLGPSYAFIRREFLVRPPRERGARDGRRVLVTLGGAGPYHAVAAVVAGLRRTDLEGLKAQVVVGLAGAQAAGLRAAAGPDIEIVEMVASMSAAMDWADVAVTGAGSTVWEAARMGLPSLLVIAAEDQRENAAELSRRGVSRVLGEASSLDAEGVAREVRGLLLDPTARIEMSSRAQSMVDGLGASRVVAMMLGQDVCRDDLTGGAA